MPLDLPPKAELCTPPAIIRPGEVWKESLQHALALRGYNRLKRRAIITEVERQATGAQIDALNKASFWSGGDLLKAIREYPVVFAMPVMGSFAAASARALRADSGVPLPEITHIAQYGTTGSASDYNILSVTFDAVAGDILVGVVRGFRSTDNTCFVDGAVIDGVTADILSTSGVRTCAAIVRITCSTTHTNGTVAISFNAAQSAGAAFLNMFRIRNSTGREHDDTNTGAGSASSIATPTGVSVGTLDDIIIFGSGHGVSSWGVFGGPNGTIVGASSLAGYTTPHFGGSHVITANLNSASTNRSIAAMSFSY